MGNVKLDLSEISRVCDEFESAWLSGERPQLNSYLFNHSSSVLDSLAIALLKVDLEYRRGLGETPEPADYESYGTEVVQLVAQLLEKSRPPLPITATSCRSLQDEFYDCTEGRYQLKEPVGAGVTGTVWKAEQLFPVERQVAVKFLRPDRPSADSRIRFFKERQLLASMKHSHIPAIYDGGNTRSGQPYLVMEFIEGTPITTFCKQQSIGFEERLELVISICRTLHYAHERGIIHRDIKASNVLMEVCQDKAIPKVIDFGFAKSTGINQEISTATLSSECGKLIGSLPYISPEQAALSYTPVDRRTDIYSIGVITYELITGTLPLATLDPENQVIWQTLEHIRRVDPERPSRRVKGKMDWSPRQQRRLATELDWIILKALEKSAARRYETAERLAQDLECFLKRWPVSAKPYAFVYRARKFCKRHLKWIAALGFGTMMLLAGVAIGLMGLNRLAKDQPPKEKSAQEINLEAANTDQQLQNVQNLIYHLTTSESCIMDFRVVPHVDLVSCYFTDSRSEGDYVLEYRRKWENVPGNVEWEPWAQVPMRLQRTQLRGAASEFCISFPAEGSFSGNTIYHLRIRRRSESRFTDEVETRTLSRQSLKSPLLVAPRQTLTFGGRQMIAGELRCPGLFRNDETGKLTNYLWDEEVLPRTTSVKMAPGTLMVTKEDRTLLGVSLRGALFVIQEEAGRLKSWNCSNDSGHSFAPQRLVCTRSWCNENVPQGAFAVNRRGQLINFFWVHEKGFYFEALDLPEKMVPSSLLVALNHQLIYGIDTSHQLICFTRSNGKMQFQAHDLPFKLCPGSLVCAASQNPQDDEGADLYGVDIQQRLVHLVWTNGKLTAELVSGDEKVIAGSLVTSADGSTLFGIQGNAADGTGVVFQLQSGEKGLEKFDCKTKFLAGSLVWGGGDRSQDGSAPGFYGVDTAGNIVNFLQVGERWSHRNVESTKVFPGTVVRHPDGEAVYAISLEGKTLEIYQELGRFIIRNLDAHSR